MKSFFFGGFTLALLTSCSALEFVIPSDGAAGAAADAAHPLPPSAPRSESGGGSAGESNAPSEPVDNCIAREDCGEVGVGGTFDVGTGGTSDTDGSAGSAGADFGTGGTLDTGTGGTLDTGSGGTIDVGTGGTVDTGTGGNDTNAGSGGQAGSAGVGGTIDVGTGGTVDVGTGGTVDTGTGGTIDVGTGGTTDTGTGGTTDTGMGGTPGIPGEFKYYAYGIPADQVEGAVVHCTSSDDESVDALCDDPPYCYFTVTDTRKTWDCWMTFTAPADVPRIPRSGPDGCDTVWDTSIVAITPEHISLTRGEQWECIPSGSGDYVIRIYAQ